MSTRIDRAIASGVATVCLLWAGLPGRAFADAVDAGPNGDTLRVLILTGRGDHDWRASTRFLRGILGNTGRFDVRVCEVPDGLGARTLEGFDVFVDDAGASAPGSDTASAIAGLVSAGKGLVITHGALGCRAGGSAGGAANQRASTLNGTGVAGCWPAFPGGGTHGSAAFCEVKFDRPEHPIVRGLQGGFRTADALFHGLAIQPGTDVLAVAKGDSGSARTSDEPALLAAGHGEGRVFCTALGHDRAAMHEREFITTFVRGAEWAATGTVTLGADIGLPRPNRDAVRALLVTGGHDHETSFYSVFDGHKDLGGIPVTTSADAFRNDLRGKYDVIVMYDFSRDLDETGKKNLRAFVESGKGVVVLHHALLDYGEWPWWYDEVVGGSYRLKPEGGVPSSTVKNDQQIYVTPADAHPITAGIGPFHIVDETYKRMRFSPQVKPLLTTDNSNSDHYLAWIGPCRTSRVVAIQLGHGPTAFGHPSYRSLVHQAILWSAGRIK
jgi:type 1 glutamine amidotransferase